MLTEPLEERFRWEDLTDRQTSILWSIWQRCEPGSMRSTFKRNWLQARSIGMCCRVYEKCNALKYVGTEKATAISFSALVSPRRNWGVPVYLSMNKQLLTHSTPPSKGSLLGHGLSVTCQWMRRGYWLPINSLRTKRRPFGTDTTVCFCQNKSLVVKTAFTVSVCLFALLNSVLCKMGYSSMPYQRCQLSLSVSKNLKLYK